MSVGVPTFTTFHAPLLSRYSCLPSRSNVITPFLSASSLLTTSCFLLRSGISQPFLICLGTIAASSAVAVCLFSAFAVVVLASSAASNSAKSSSGISNGVSVGCTPGAAVPVGSSSAKILAASSYGMFATDASSYPRAASAWRICGVICGADFGCERLRRDSAAILISPMPPPSSPIASETMSPLEVILPSTAI